MLVLIEFCLQRAKNIDSYNKKNTGTPQHLFDIFMNHFSYFKRQTIFEKILLLESDLKTNEPD